MSTVFFIFFFARYGKKGARSAILPYRVLCFVLLKGRAVARFLQRVEAVLFYLFREAVTRDTEQWQIHCGVVAPYLLVYI